MKKEIILLILFLIIMLGIYFIGRDRFTKIEDGSMIQVSEDYMDR